MNIKKYNFNSPYSNLNINKPSMNIKKYNFNSPYGNININKPSVLNEHKKLFSNIAKQSQRLISFKPLIDQFY